MSVRTDVINLYVNVNGDKARNELNDLHKSAAHVSKEIKELSKEEKIRGTTFKEAQKAYEAATKKYGTYSNEVKNAAAVMRTEADAYFKVSAALKSKTAEMGVLEGKMTKLRSEIGLTALTMKELRAEERRLTASRNDTVIGSDNYKKFDVQLSAVKARISEVNKGLVSFSSFLNSTKNEVKQFGIMTASYLGFQFITSQFQNVIGGLGKVSDQLADLQRVSGMTAKEAENLAKKLKEVDTRTSVQGLNEIAIIAGKLGVAKENIFDFTKAVDQLVVALGDELGDADAITTQLGKILNVFDGKVTGDNISKLGNAMVKLANAGVASGGFIADFTQRVSAISKSAGLGLGEVTGLAAGLEELGFRSESSSTAIQKLLSTIAADLPKAAKIAGATTKNEIAAYAEQFAKAPQEAMIRFAEGLSKNKGSFADVAASFKDAGEEGARVVAVLSAVGQKGDFMREKMKLGAEAIKETSEITSAFALKNENFGATLDKLGKEFNKFTNSPGVTNFLKGAVEIAAAFVKIIVSLPAALVKYTLAFGALIVAIAAYNSGMITSAKNSIIAATNTLKNTIAINAQRIALIAVRVAQDIATRTQAAAAIAAQIFTKQISLTTAATQLWSTVLKGSLIPVTLLATAVGVIVGGVIALTKAYRDNAKEMILHNETIRMANEEIAKEKSQLDTMTKVLQDYTISQETRENVLKDLIALSPEYLGRLTLENVATSEGKEILDNYNRSLEANARLKAASVLKDREFQKRISLETTRQELEIASKSGAGFSDLSEGAQAAFSKTKTSVGRTALTSSLLNLIPSKEDYAEAFKGINEEIKKQDQLINAATNNFIDKTKEKENARKTFLYNEVSQSRKALNEAIKGTKEYDEARKEYEEIRQKYLEEFAGVNKPSSVVAAINPTTKTGNKKADADYKKLIKEADDFYKQLQQLKEKALIKGEEPEQKEIDSAELKYKELLDKAKSFYLERLKDKKKYGDAEKLIEEAKQSELDAIIKKYADIEEKKANEELYKKAQQRNEDFFENERKQELERYNAGLISGEEYEKVLTEIQKREIAKRIAIHKAYSDVVDAAGDNALKDRKKLEEELTKELIDQAKARERLKNMEKQAAAELEIKKFNSKNPFENKKAQIKAAEDEKDRRIAELKKEMEAAGMAVTDEALKNSAVYQNIMDEFNAKIKATNKSFWEEMSEGISMYGSYITNLWTSVNKFFDALGEKQLAAEKKRNQEKRNDYKKQLDSKLISEKQYNKKVAEADAALDKKTKEIQREQARREKALNIFNAIVNTAVAVTKALASAGPPYNFILAAAVGVAGALQTAAIASQPLPELGTGEWLRKGPKHKEAGKGTPVLIERDEAVMSAAAMTDNKRYTVTGTPSQITSALNSKNGGVSWQPGAVLQIAEWRRRPSPTISSEMPHIMAQGGINGTSKNITINNTPDNEELIRKLDLLLLRMEERDKLMANWKDQVKAVVSIKEFREESEKYDNAKRVSSLGG